MFSPLLQHENNWEYSGIRSSPGADTFPKKMSSSLTNKKPCPWADRIMESRLQDISFFLLKLCELILYSWKEKKQNFFSNYF